MSDIEDHFHRKTRIGEQNPSIKPYSTRGIRRRAIHESQRLRSEPTSFSQAMERGLSYYFNEEN